MCSALLEGSGAACAGAHQICQRHQGQALAFKRRMDSGSEDGCRPRQSSCLRRRQPGRRLYLG